MTGADLVEELWQAARRQGVTLGQFVAPLTCVPTKYVKQLRLAKSPTPATIERIRALIAGEPVPPPPPNNFQRFNAYQAAAGTPAGYRKASAQRVDELAAARGKIEHRRALAEAAAALRRPGETLADAVRRIELAQGLAA